MFTGPVRVAVGLTAAVALALPTSAAMASTPDVGGPVRHAPPLSDPAGASRWSSEGSDEDFQRQLARVYGGAPAKHARATALPGAKALTSAAKAAQPSLDLQPCESDDTFLCGTVTVPLDRAHPGDGRTIGVHVEVAPHTGAAQKPKGTIVATSGGPGEAMSAGEKYGFRDYMLAPLTEDYDLVFIDQRGLGQSQAIDCPAWQHERPTYRAAAACARQLGAARQFYGSADVADDTEAVRRALGVRKIIIVGGSYAGNDVVTYAARHRTHVKLAVASSPYLPVGDDTFAPYVPEATPAVVKSICERNTGCIRENSSPRRQLAWLAERLRAEPVVGTGYDADGRPHQVRVTEALLLNWILRSNFGQGEIVQASAALRAGDRTPLLRLAAENDVGTVNWDSGDPTQFSNGDYLGRVCTDIDFPWDETAPANVRRQQYAAAFAAEPETYGLFAKEAWAARLPVGWYPSPCIANTWKVKPGYADGTTVPGIPSLILLGEYDLVVPRANAVRAADVLVDSTVVDVATAGHNPWWWRECAAETVQRFIQTAQVTDVCAGDPPRESWFVGSFPRVVAEAPKAKRLAGDHSTAGDRRLVTAAVWTVLDSIGHTYPSENRAGRGLRGGDVVIVWSEIEGIPDVFHLDHVRFAADLRVDGIGYTNWWESGYGADITVRGPGGVRGHLEFLDLVDTPESDVLRVSGTIDGRRVHLAVRAT